MIVFIRMEFDTLNLPIHPTPVNRYKYPFSLLCSRSQARFRTVFHAFRILETESRIMKDHFSDRADLYARYRPSYPAELFDFLNSLVPAKENAWDCGTGNGQVAVELAGSFREVYATDISETQLANAPRRENIHYSAQPAEQTSFESDFFDLITVAQAIHWFDFEQFYREVRRTARKNAILCVLGYGRVRISEAIDALIDDFYHQVIGPYWDAERRYIDENYTTIPFPFREEKVPDFVNRLEWSLAHLSGYLHTWSAVTHFESVNGFNPLEQLLPELETHWGHETVREVRFPILLRIGHVQH